MRFRLAVLSALVTCVVLVFSAPASASVNTLWHMTSLDGIATDVARMPLTVVADDDASDWQTVFPDCGECVLGFAVIDAAPGSFADHVIFLSPSVYATYGEPHPSYNDAAVAIMTLIHESLHWGLNSGDEGRVNACALHAFPSVIQHDFHIPATTTQAYTYRTNVVRRVRLRGRWVRLVRSVQHTGTRTIGNPDFVGLTQAAQAFYQSQPPPYSTGTCS